MGGAQAIAALAYGTESVTPVDVIVGPGNPYVQEAKRQVRRRRSASTASPGPSELVVVATDGADPELIALDLLAQAEHGADSPVWCISPDAALLDAVVAAVERLAPERPSGRRRDCSRSCEVADAALRSLAERSRPSTSSWSATRPRRSPSGSAARAACSSARGAATAFGDYVAGSNHVLPTGGAARFQSALSPATFRRRMARVSLPREAAARLAPAGAALARAEGFPVHAESMERRA